MDNKTLRKLQLTELDMLVMIDKICRDNNIEYFLIGGTLIGAVRHKGFIPWDDDIDIGMLRSDYEKFIDLCINENVLGDDYFLDCNESDNNYFIPFIKIKKNNTTFAEKSIDGIDIHKGIFLDVFPYDNVPKQDSFVQKIQAIVVRNIQYAIYVKYHVYKLKDKRRKVFTWFLTLLPSKTLKKLNKYFSTIFEKKSNNKYIVSLAGSSPYYEETLLKERLFPLKKIKFEGYDFFAFKENDYYLSQLYGNYMQLPPIEERRNHNPVCIDFNKGKCQVNRKKYNNKQKKQ